MFHVKHCSDGVFHVKHPGPLLPNTEISKDYVKNVFYIDAPQQLPKPVRRHPQIFGHQLGMLRQIYRTPKRIRSVAQQLAVPRPADQRGLVCEMLRSKSR